MQINVSFVSTSLEKLENLRRERAIGLSEPPPLLLEARTQPAPAWSIEHRGHCCGYVIVDDEANTLLEFHLQQSEWVFAEHVLRRACARLGVTTIWVASFDTLVFSSAVAHAAKVRSLGLLVRDYIERELPQLPSIRFTSRTAEPEDWPYIARIDQAVFTDKTRLRHAIAAEEVVLFEDDLDVVGFGMRRPIPRRVNEVEVSVVVAASYRRRGHAVYMLRYLVDECRARGLRAVASCAESNLASRYVGERVGMVARHRLLEIQLAVTRAGEAAEGTTSQSSKTARSR